MAFGFGQLPVAVAADGAVRRLLASRGGTAGGPAYRYWLIEAIGRC